MLVQNSYEYIKLGLAIRLLRNINAKDPKNFATETIDALTEGLNAINFIVTLAYMGTVTYCDMLDSLNNIPENEQEVGEEISRKISNEFQKIETILFPESLTKNIYILPSRRFNTESLLYAPNKLFKEGTFNKLDSIAKSDITAACRCILFGEATAVAFHILRATEEILKLYYFYHIPTSDKDSVHMWGNMLTELTNKTKDRPPTVLLTSLDNIRKSYRNPTQHPDAIYDIDRAQDLFGVCQDVIGQMASELPETPIV